MLLKTIKGLYQLQYNYKDAFNLEDFTSKYIEECFDNYPYIVGDISSGILRLKGFESKNNSDEYFRNIKKYLEVSCAFGCPFYILKRMKSEDDYNKIPEALREVKSDALFVIPSIEKVNYDKESLELESTPKTKSRINLDMRRLTTVKVMSPSRDVEEFIKQDQKNNTPKEKKIKPQENVTSYVSASPDFDPSKKVNNKFNNNNKNRNNNNQNKDNNQNKNNPNNNNQNKDNNQNKNNPNKNNQNLNKNNNLNNNNNKNPNNKNNHKQKNKNNGFKKEQKNNG